MIAADLVAWTRLLALTGDAAPLAACEPKALRYRLLHVQARLTRSGRRRHLRIPKTWPWAAPGWAVFPHLVGWSGFPAFCGKVAGRMAPGWAVFPLLVGWSGFPAFCGIVAGRTAPGSAVFPLSRCGLRFPASCGNLAGCMAPGWAVPAIRGGRWFRRGDARVRSDGRAQLARAAGVRRRGAAPHSCCRGAPAWLARR